MSGRGRGRAAFGRGRGGPPEIRDEDGQYVTRDVAGPPPVYPEIEMPHRQPPSDDALQLKAKWRALTSYWKKSPYHLKLSDTKIGVKRSLEDFLGTDAPRDRLETGQLAKVLTLHPKYFPEELFTPQEKRVSSKAASQAGQKQYWAAMSRTLKDSSGSAFDRLAKMEARQEVTLTAAAVDNAVVKVEEGALEEEAEQENETGDEPDEEDFEDDDYMQGQDFDDDEGYEDNFGDDGDDGGGGYY